MGTECSVVGTMGTECSVVGTMGTECSVEGKGHPITGHQGPTGELEV
jgi:hypothetical protein